MGSVILRTNEAKIAWSLNFEEKFPSLAVSLGFSFPESTALLNDSRNMRFAILNGISATAYSKAANAFKYDLLNGVEDGEPEPVLPVLTVAEPPDPIVLAGIIDRLTKAIARMKTSAGYSESIGEQLLIVQPEEDDAIEPTTKPTGQATSLPAMIRIDWVKGKFDGVIIESQRGDETEWTRLDRDTRSPFDDERPNFNAGKPEERRYRLRYFLGDEPVGTFSDVIVAVTMV